MSQRQPDHPDSCRCSGCWSDCWMDAAYAAISTGEHRRAWEPCGVCMECLRLIEERLCALRGQAEPSPDWEG